jgi:hypothetical protein
MQIPREAVLLRSFSERMTSFSTFLFMKQLF